MASEDEALWITYNGEVYNFLELRLELERAGAQFRSHSDTEVILHAYRAWGTECVHRFVGMWAFCIADLNRGILFCSRDRFGIKPFHYCQDGSSFAFGSEIKQLARLGLIKDRVNDQAVYEYLVHGSFDHAPETFFENVLRLSPGTNLIVDLATSALRLARYYEPSFSINAGMPVSLAADKFRHLLDDSIRLHMRSDVEVGSCLSGGLDSSSIVCIVRRQLEQLGTAHLQRTFSSHFADPEADELEYMEAVVAATGVKAHFTFPKFEDLMEDLDALIWHQEEPFGSSSIFAQWSVFKLVRENGVKVMLDGQGADEQLAGYLGFLRYYLDELWCKGRLAALLRESLAYRRVHRATWDTALPSPVARVLSRVRGPRTHAPSWLRPEFSELHGPRSYYSRNAMVKAFPEDEGLNNLLYQMTFCNNLASLLRYEDRNSMAFSVEARVPFLDHRLVEFVFSLPSDLKIRNGHTKFVMREAMRGILPEKIRSRAGKLGFATPEQKWQLGPLRQMIEEALRSDSLARYVVPDRAREYWSFVTRAGSKDFAPWRWLNLKLWIEKYGFG